MTRIVAAALVVASAGCAVATAGCAAPSTVQDTPTTLPPPAGSPAALRVLAVTATAGFRHGSIPTARQVLQTLAARDHAFVVTFTEDLADLTGARLAGVDVLIFLLTSGELPLDATQKGAMLAFVNGGGGFVGVHSATDTLYDWPEYGRLVGAYFKEHPWTQEATVVVEDRVHLATRDLGASLRLLEEYYTFRDNPRPSVEVLLSLDAASVGTGGDFPLAWSQSVGAGRSFYSALGHFESTWTDARFQAHVAGAIRWAGRRE